MAKTASHVTKSTGKALAKPVTKSSFLALAGGQQEIIEIINENVGTRGFTESDLERIKLPLGGTTRWEIPTATGKDSIERIECVVLAFRDVRTYFSEPYTGQRTPPSCYSPDTYVGIGQPGGQCKSCPLSQFGTKLDLKGKAGRGQACAERKVLLILRPQSKLPCIISVPPTSGAAIRKYMLLLTNESKIFRNVTTILELEEAKNSTGVEFSRVVATKGRDLTEEEIAGVIAYREALMPAFAGIRISHEDAAQG